MTGRKLIGERKLRIALINPWYKRYFERGEVFEGIGDSIVTYPGGYTFLSGASSGFATTMFAGTQTEFADCTWGSQGNSSSKWPLVIINPSYKDQVSEPDFVKVSRLFNDVVEITVGRANVTPSNLTEFIGYSKTSATALASKIVNDRSKRELIWPSPYSDQGATREEFTGLEITDQLNLDNGIQLTTEQLKRLVEPMLTKLWQPFEKMDTKLTEMTTKTVPASGSVANPTGYHIGVTQGIELIDPAKMAIVEISNDIGYDPSTGRPFVVTDPGSQLDDAWGAAVRAMKQYEEKIKYAALLAEYKMLTAAEMAGVPTERPEETIDSGLSVKHLKYCNDWWAQMLKIRGTLETNKVVDPAAGLAAYNSSKGNVPPLTLNDAKLAVATEANGIKWGDLAKRAGSWLSGAAGKVFDTVASWGPTGILTAWAGYETIQSAKDSSIPTWAIGLAFGAVALMIMK